MKFTGERCILGESGFLIEKEHLDRYNFALKFVEGKVILDVACGSGYGSKILSKRAKKVIGVDISKESINYAKENFNSKNIEFRQGSATNLNFIKDNSIDRIISFETIEHLKEYTLFLSEIKRILKKGGLFIVSTPNKKISSPHSKKPKNPYHIIEFYKKDLEELLKNYFKLIAMYGQEQRTFIIALKNKIAMLFFILIFGKSYWSPYVRYLANNLKQINKKNIENCLFLIAVCRK